MQMDDYVVDITGKQADIQIDMRKFRIFILLQGLAILILLVSLKHYMDNRKIYEKEVDYQPVTVTYTSSVVDSYTNLDGKSLTRYTNRFQYEVNGIVYSYTAQNQSSKVNRGAKDTWYYNPNNPEQIVPYASFETVESTHKIMLHVYLAFQVIAIFLLIWSLKIWRKNQNISWTSGDVLESNVAHIGWNESTEWKPESQDFEAWDSETKQSESAD